MANRSMQSFHLTMTMHSRVYYLRLQINNDTECTGYAITKHSLAYCQHLPVKKSNTDWVLQKRIRQSG